MTAPAEYRAARSALLDALLGLDGQIDSVIVVGAQAIYLHLGDTDIGINAPPTTTDGDLALDAEILAPEPNLAGALHAAGFTPGQQPGTWNQRHRDQRRSDGLPSPERTRQPQRP